MNLLATLDKPFTDGQKQEFIENYYIGTNIIQETNKRLEAWEYTEEDDIQPYIPEPIPPTLEQAKTNKSEENTFKCHEKLTQGSFELDITIENVIHKVSYFYDTSTQNNLNSSALGFLSGVITRKEWTDEDGNTVYLSQENIAEMLLTLETWGNPIWAKWGEFKKQIDVCTTVEEVEAIDLNYDINESVEEPQEEVQEEVNAIDLNYEINESE